MDDRSRVTTILFTDIEGSTRLWEQEPERMRDALARHDVLGRAAVEGHRGVLVKSTGDGLHAAFDDPCDALAAALAIQQALLDRTATAGLALAVRAGVHSGIVERRDHDYFGTPVNRAARIMAIAHGGQTLVSQAVADLVRGRLPPEVSLRDLGSVRLRDLSGSERVYQLLHPALRSDFPALRSLESTPNNLPQQLTTFVGREREQDEVRRMLRATRLLTLCGTGGLGKTRLALQVAAAALVDFPDGVWFVDLAPVADAGLVPQAVASVLGVKDDPGGTVQESLARFVRERALLVVLDNCEHVVEACARLAIDLLQASTHLVMLATSREALRVRGETTYPVPALAVPDPGDAVDPSTLDRYAALRLFADRARSVQPAFAIGARNADAVADICRRLDGIPLAIELAAARLRSLPLETIAARLDDAFRLLSAGDRTALPRQQTLRALIDWSHDLLAPPERALFRRLAVFAGSFALDAAEAVGAGADVARDDVLDLLAALVDKSLVAVDPDAARYRLLETVRQYANGKLHEAGEVAAVRARHAEHYAALAERARPELAGRDQAAWLGRLDLERENLLAAHAWCLQHPDAGARGLQLVTAMKQYFVRRGLLALGDGLTTEALAHPGAQRRDAERSRALFAAGQLLMGMGRNDRARAVLEESLAIARESGDRRRAAAVLQPLGLVLTAQGEFARARECYDEAVRLAREFGDRREMAAAISNRVQLLQLEGELEPARPLLLEVLAIMRECEDHENIGLALLNIAMIDVETRRLGAARAAIGEAIGIAARTGSRTVGQSAIEISSGLAAAAGDWRTAALLFGAAEANNAKTGLRRSAADESFLAPRIALARAALGETVFDDGVREGRTLALGDALERARSFVTAGADPAATAS